MPKDYPVNHKLRHDLMKQIFVVMHCNTFIDKSSSKSSSKPWKPDWKADDKVTNLRQMLFVKKINENIYTVTSVQDNHVCTVHSVHVNSKQYQYTCTSLWW